MKKLVVGIGVFALVSGSSGFAGGFCQGFGCPGWHPPTEIPGPSGCKTGVRSNEVVLDIPSCY